MAKLEENKAESPTASAGRKASGSLEEGQMAPGKSHALKIPGIIANQAIAHGL
jgi:hypothetical protein